MTDKLFTEIECFVYKQQDNECTVELQFNFKNQADELHIACWLEEFIRRELVPELEHYLDTKIEIESSVSKASNKTQ